MKLDVKIYTIFVLAILIGFIPLRNATSATNLGTTISTFGLDPTIDGKFETAEWISSAIYYYPMYKTTDQSDTMDLYFRTTYSATNLSIGITIYDDNTAGSEGLIVFFKVNTTGDLVNINAGDPYYGNGNDAKALYLDNRSIDCFTLYSSFVAFYETSVYPGSSNDMAGEVGITTNVKVDFEMSMALDSGDIPESCDIALEASDTIEIFFYYFDDSGHYSGYRDTDLDYNYYILELYVPPDPVTITPPPETITQNNTITTTVEGGIILLSTIFTSAFGLIIAFVIIRKRRK